MVGGWSVGWLALFVGCRHCRLLPRQGLQLPPSSEGTRLWRAYCTSAPSAYGRALDDIDCDTRCERFNFFQFYISLYSIGSTLLMLVLEVWGRRGPVRPARLVEVWLRRGHLRQTLRLHVLEVRRLWGHVTPMRVLQVWRCHGHVRPTWVLEGRSLGCYNVTWMRGSLIRLHNCEHKKHFKIKCFAGVMKVPPPPSLHSSSGSSDQFHYSLWSHPHFTTKK
jgi:hypothetical protein